MQKILVEIQVLEIREKCMPWPLQNVYIVKIYTRIPDTPMYTTLKTT